MAILARCPNSFCKRYQSVQNKRCKCGQNLDAAKRAKRVRYSITYRDANGKQKKRSYFSAFAIITGIPFIKFITGLGAASAIILLIFRDTILGFVASIQVSINDMVRIGDWITFEKYGADGDVIEINLSTVKVQNFDKTITTIPTYALIYYSFNKCS